MAILRTQEGNDAVSLDGMDRVHKFYFRTVFAARILAYRCVRLASNRLASSPGIMLLYARELSYGRVPGEPVFACVCRQYRVPNKRLPSLIHN